MADATVSIARGTASHPDVAAMTDDQGRYRLPCDGAGEFEIVVYAGDHHASRTVRVETGDAAADVELG